VIFLELFRQCDILELFRQCDILELFRQCDIVLFFILLIHILDKSKDYISSPYLNFNNAKGRGTIDITRNNTEIKFKYRVDVIRLGKQKFINKSV
jgi:hypothetical protein